MALDTARRGAGPPRGGGDGTAALNRAGREAPPRKGAEFWWWVFMRVSGIVLVFLVIGHVLIMHVFGGGIERRYRRMRPEVEALPWASFDASVYDDEVRLAARAAWTRAAFQEHRTAAAVSVSLRALVEARAPLDLIGVATRFPLDEVTHVELCARMRSATQRVCASASGLFRVAMRTSTAAA